MQRPAERPDPPAGPSVEGSESSGGRSIAALLLGALVAAAVAWVAVTDPAPGAPAAAPPAPLQLGPPSQPTGSPAAAPAQRASAAPGGDAAPPAQAPSPLAAPPGNDELAVAVAVTTSVGDGTRVAWLAREGSTGGSPGAPDLALREVSFDASNRWAAGIGAPGAAGGGPVLWATRATGRWEPAAVGVSSVAWHDQRPGVLAWTEPAGDRTAIVTADLDASPPRRHRVLAPAGLELRVWGEWGYVLGDDHPGYRTTLLGPDGTVVWSDQPGIVGGAVPGLGLLHSVPGQLPGTVSAIDPVTLRPTGLLVATFGEFPWDVAVTPAGDAAAVHLARGYPHKPRNGRVLVLDRAGQVTSRFDDVDGWAALAWSADGRVLGFVRQGGPTTARVLLHDRHDGTHTEIEPAGLGRSERIDALALVPQPGNGSGRAAPTLVPGGRRR